MGLMKCPDCGKDVSTSAPACPHCGKPMQPPVLAPPDTADIAWQKGYDTGLAEGKYDRNPASYGLPPKPRNWRLLGLIVVFCIVLLMALATFEQYRSLNPRRTASDIAKSGRSIAWQKGYDTGLYHGKSDRNHASYGMAYPSDMAKETLTEVYCKCRPGSEEYGDFWEGYDAGYSVGRR